MRNSQKCTHGRFYGDPEKYHKKRRSGGQNVHKTKNICSIVLILVNYLDNSVTIILQKFLALVTSITRKVIDVSDKKTCFEIINEINKWQTRDTNILLQKGYL